MTYKITRNDGASFVHETVDPPQKEWGRPAWYEPIPEQRHSAVLERHPDGTPKLTVEAGDMDDLHAVYDNGDWHPLEAEKPDWYADGNVPVLDGDTVLIRRATVIHHPAEYTVAEIVPTAAERIKAMSDRLDGMVDAVALEWGFASTDRLIGWFVSFDPEWRAQGEAFVRWRDAFWRAAIAGLKAFQDGEITTEEEFLARLPPPPEKPTGA